ncbi:MAG: LuxR family transcriptional regulator fused with ATPase domain [Ilumatobacteraceae bacterium]|nr:LuxR family transcriptional regulator fused with ATPase domain [Ilumatobacteraceae bacterium]
MADAFDRLASEWPLVGRAQALDRFATILAADDSGAGRGIAFVGSAGVGKTRLAAGCVDLAAAAGYRIARVAGSRAAASIPFGAAASLLSADAGGSGPAEPADVIRRAHEVLTDHGPLCLMVDDAHLLDDASITLVQHVAGTPGVVAVITVRADRPVSAAMTALWRGGALARIDLDGLDRVEHDALLAAALGGPMDEPGARRLFEAGGGNPLFTRELLMAAEDDNALLPDGSGGWRLSRLPRSSSRLAELVAGRVGALDDAERRCLETIAVAEPIGLDVIEGMGFATVMARLERRRLVTATTAGNRVEVTIAHPLYADIVRDRLLPLRARNIRRTLADHLERTGGRRRGDASRIAGWRLDAGLTVTAPHLLVASAEALVAGDPASASRFARAAHDVDPTGASALALARVALVERDGVAVERLLAEAADLSTTVDLGRAMRHIRMRNAFWNLGDDRGAHDADADTDADVVDELRIAGGDPAGGSEAVHLRALDLLARGGFRSALALLRGVDDPERRAGLEALVLVEGGWLADGEALAWRTASDASATATPDGWALLAIARRRIDDGDGQAALVAADGAIEALLRTDEPLGIVLGEAAAAEALTLLGEVATARRRLGSVAPHVQRRLFGAALDRARAAVDVAAGDHASAAKVLRDRVAVAAAAGHRSAELGCLHDLVRLSSATAQELARVVALADELDAPRAALTARHAQGIGDGTGLGLVAGELEVQGFAVWACEVSMAAAQLLTTSGAARQAAAEQRRAARLRSGFPRAVLFAPTTIAPEETPALRPGELQVARLAVRGMSDREIGEELHLSVRTVGNYLLRAYRRLGVRGRDELAAALADELDG